MIINVILKQSCVYNNLYSYDFLSHQKYKNVCVNFYIYDLNTRMY